MSILFILLFGLLWGSFLNVVAIRSMNDQSIIAPRSHCPHCKTTLAWYDMIPVISWLWLNGRCRTCKTSISLLYPFIEIITALIITVLYLCVPALYIGSYFIFFSTLIVIIRTDLEYMLIPYSLMIYAIIIAFISSYMQVLPISFTESIAASIIGYGTLWSIATLYYRVTKKRGLGSGDFDLLAMIGAFTGINGMVTTLFIGSWLGSIIGILYIFISGQKLKTRIPFAPFLACGAISYVLFHAALYTYLPITFIY